MAANPRLVAAELLDCVGSCVAYGASGEEREAARAALGVQLGRLGASPAEALAPALELVGVAVRRLAEECESSPAAVVEHLRDLLFDDEDDGTEPATAAA